MKTETSLPFSCSRIGGRSLALALSLALPLTPGLVTESHAQTLWTGAGEDNLWTTPENWSEPLVTGGTANVQFGVSDKTTQVTGQSWYLNTIRFNSGASAYTINALGTNLITLGGTAMATTDTVITNASSHTQTFGGDVSISGSGKNRGLWASTAGFTFNGVVAGGSNKVMLQGIGDFQFNKTVSIVGNNGSLLLDSNFTGTATFAWANYFEQYIAIRNGTFRMAHGAALGVQTTAIEMGIHVNAPASTGYLPKLLVGGAYTVNRNILLHNTHLGGVVIGGDTAHTSTFASKVNLGNTAGKALTVTAAAGGTVRFTGNVEGSLTGTDNNDALTKTGEGTVILAGAANSYSGATEVHEGRLLINGAYSEAGEDILVASGAAFGGSGTVDRNVYLGSGATLVAGNGVDTSGMLTLDGDLALGSDVTIELTLGTGLTHSGLERLGGDWSFNTDQGFLLTGDLGWGVYTGVITGLTGDEAGLLSIDQWRILNTDWEDSWFVYEAGQIHLHAIPEPSTVLLIGGGAFGLLGLGWKRRRTVG